MVITLSPSTAIDDFLSELSHIFPFKDLGRLSFFLGLEFDYMPTGLLVSQSKYIYDLLRKTNMITANLVFSLMPSSIKLSKFDTPSFIDPALFRIVVGSIQYISLTRPDIFFVVNKVYQFLHHPKLSLGLL